MASTPWHLILWYKLREEQQIHGNKARIYHNHHEGDSVKKPCGTGLGTNMSGVLRETNKPQQSWELPHNPVQKWTMFGGSLTDSGRCPFRGGHERPKGCSGITLGQDTRRSEPIGTEEIRLDNGSQCRHTHPVSLGGLIHNKVPPDGGSAELERTTTDW